MAEAVTLERCAAWVWGYWLGWLVAHWFVEGYWGAWLALLLSLSVLRVDREPAAAEFDWSLAERQMEGWRLRALERDTGGKYEVN